MARMHLLGKHGEILARKALEEAGICILETNWRSGRHEIDIIAKDREFLIFVEVKTRSSMRGGLPELAVKSGKQKSIMRAANHYVRQNGLKQEVRFDVISIVATPSTLKLSHIKNAFSANPFP